MKEWETSFPFYVPEAIEDVLLYLKERTDEKRENAPIDIGGTIHEEERRRVFVNFFLGSRFHATIKVSWRDDATLLSMKMEECIHERFSEYDHEYFENLAGGIELLAGMYRDLAKIIYAAKTIVDARSYDPDKEPPESRPVTHSPDNRSFDDLKDLYEHTEIRPARHMQLWIDRIPPERACEVVRVISHILNIKYAKGFVATREVGAEFKHVGYRWYNVLVSAGDRNLVAEIVYTPDLGVVSVDLNEEANEWFSFDPLREETVNAYANYLREVAKNLKDYSVIFEELVTTLKQLERYAIYRKEGENA